MKKISAILIVLLLLPFIMLPVSAAEDSRSFHFELSLDGAENRYVQKGDLITVTLYLNRTDSEEAYPLYAMQDEIRYNSDFFELVEDGALLASGITGHDVARPGGYHEFYMNCVSLSGNTQWTSRKLIGSFQLRVISDTGVSRITSQDYSVSREGGFSSYPVTANELTLKVSDACLVRFETNGGTEMEEQTIRYQDRLFLSSNPEQEGKKFVGWFRDPDGQIPWNFETDLVEENIILYAIWENLPQDDDPPYESDPSAETAGPEETHVPETEYPPRNPEDSEPDETGGPWDPGTKEPPKEPDDHDWLNKVLLVEVILVGSGLILYAGTKLVPLLIRLTAGKKSGFAMIPIPDLRTKTVLLCLSETPSHEKFRTLLSKKKFIDLKTVSFDKKEQLLRKIGEEELDMVIVSSDITQPVLQEISDEIRRKEGKTLLGVIVRSKDEKEKLETLAVKAASADEEDSPDRKMGKLITQLYKTEITLENGALAVGQIADAMGIPLVSFVVEIYLTGKDLKEVLDKEKADCSDAAEITGDIAELFGMYVLSGFAHAVSFGEAMKQRSDDAKTSENEEEKE